jgi:hypothetical protein
MSDWDQVTKVGSNVRKYDLRGLCDVATDKMTAFIDKHPDNVHDDQFLQAVRLIYGNTIFDGSNEIRMTLANALATKPLTRASVPVCVLITDFSDLGLDMAFSLQSTATRTAFRV